MRGDGWAKKRKKGGWQIGYYVPGKGEQRESVAKLLGKPADAVTEQDAIRALQRRRVEVQIGEWPEPRVRKVLVAQIIDEYRRHRENERVKATPSFRSRLRALTRGFGSLQARRITTPVLDQWVEDQREQQSYADGTIHTLLAQFHAVLAWGKTQGYLREVPKFPTIRVDNARQGFAEPDQFRAVHAELGEPECDAALAAYVFGRRINEVLSWQWMLVDRRRRELRVAAHDTKKDDPAVIPLEGEVWEMLERRWAKRVLGCPFVFHRAGQKLTYPQFYAAWKAAAARAGVPALLVHDLCRTAARDMIDAGAAEVTAMHIMGRKSRSIFLRYAIRNTRVMRRALQETAASRAALLAGLSDNSRTLLAGPAAEG